MGETGEVGSDVKEIRGAGIICGGERGFEKQLNENCQLSSFLRHLRHFFHISSVSNHV